MNTIFFNFFPSSNPKEQNEHLKLCPFSTFPLSFPKPPDQKTKKQKQLVSPVMRKPNLMVHLWLTPVNVTFRMREDIITP